MAKTVLGKGMDALFSSEPQNDAGITELKIAFVEPRPDQPRKSFDKEALESLAESIKEHGVIQPIIVVPGDNGYYRIIAGERRWRAAKLAGLSTIPAIIRDMDSLAAAEVALVENLQREDLDPIEEALGYRSLMDQFGITQEQVSDKVGKSRPHVANMLRLLSLDAKTKEFLREGRISAGHARALLAIEDAALRSDLAKRAADGLLTVRDIENAAKEVKTAKPKKKSAAKKSRYPDVADTLSKKFGTKVQINGTDKRGKIEISYYSMDDLTRIVDLL